jgi:hypothetical protein
LLVNYRSFTKGKNVFTNNKIIIIEKMHEVADQLRKISITIV